MPFVDTILYVAGAEGLSSTFAGVTFPGCVQFAVDSGELFPYADDVTRTWEDLGVPVGKYVQCVNLINLQRQRTGGNTFLTNDWSVGIQFLDMSDNPISDRMGRGYAGTPLNIWLATPENLPDPTQRGRLSSTPLKIRVDGHLDGGFPTLQAKEFTLRIIYGDTDIGLCTCELDVTPATATITSSETQQFAAVGHSTPVNWSVIGGAGNGTVDATGLYTPPATPGTYTVVATSQSDGSCFDGATVTVTSSATATEARTGGGGLLRGVAFDATNRTGAESGGVGLMRATAFTPFKTIFPFGNPAIKLHMFGGLGSGRPFSQFDSRACFQLYFAGAKDMDDFTATQYGLPTEVCIDNPQYGQARSVTVTPGDLAGFRVPGSMGDVKLRRQGGDTYAKPIVFRGLEIRYKKRPGT